MEQYETESSAWMVRSMPHLMALLLQYNSRTDSGEVYLEEGRQVTTGFGQTCARSGLSLAETMQAFLLFRRSLLQAIFEAGLLGGCDDHEGQRLFQRTNDFLDALMLNLIDSYHASQYLHRKESNGCS